MINTSLVLQLKGCSFGNDTFSQGYKVGVRKLQCTRTLDHATEHKLSVTLVNLPWFQVH